MAYSSSILSSIKSQVQKVAPRAKVLLFGSRAYGTPNEESDWDILILTETPVNAAIEEENSFYAFPVKRPDWCFYQYPPGTGRRLAKQPSYYFASSIR